MSLPIGLTKAFYVLLRAEQLSESTKGTVTTIRCAIGGCPQHWARIESENKATNRAATATDRRVAALHIAQHHSDTYARFCEGGAK